MSKLKMTRELCFDIIIQNSHERGRASKFYLPADLWCGFVHILTADVPRSPSSCQLSSKWLLFTQSPSAAPTWPSPSAAFNQTSLNSIPSVLTPGSNFTRFHHNISIFHTLLTLILVVLNHLRLCPLCPHHCPRSVIVLKKKAFYCIKKNQVKEIR